MAKTILLVCTGNTCRSPMAEALLKRALEDVDEEMQVLSAGTSAISHQPAAREAIEALEEKGISLQEHSSRPLTLELIEEAWLILTMTMSHKDQIIKMAPWSADKVFTLKEYVDGNAYMEMEEEINALEKEEGERLQELAKEQQEEEEALREKWHRLRKELDAVEQELEELLKRRYKAVEDLRNRRQQLMESLGKAMDIQDPFGKDLEEYRTTGEEIGTYVDKVAERLNNEERRRKEGSSE